MCTLLFLHFFVGETLGFFEMEQKERIVKK